MKNTKIVHIDYGTKGNAGLYLERILCVPQSEFSVEAYVHNDFQATRSNAKVIRIFDKFSKYIPFNPLKNLYRLVDLYCCFLIIIIRLQLEAKKNSITVFVALFQSFHAYHFLANWLARSMNLVVTVHDATEHKHSYPSLIMCQRDLILQSADHLLVHGPDSVLKLKYLNKPFLMIPFPLMRPDQSRLIMTSPQEPGVTKLLFIGHIRWEKGLDILLEVWRALPPESLKRLQLTIAGTYPKSLAIDFDKLSQVQLILEFIDDIRFEQMIYDTDYVVFPYREGTNSGVLSVAASLGKPCITSSIPLFLESPFFIRELSFATSEELAEILKRCDRESSRTFSERLKRLVDVEDSKFDAEVIKCYRSV